MTIYSKTDLLIEDFQDTTSLQTRNETLIWIRKTYYVASMKNRKIGRKYFGRSV